MGYFIAGAVGVLVSYFVFYLIIKTAVRNAIIEARQFNDTKRNDKTDDIGQVICPNCGKSHDMDYPKCPYCKYKY